MALTPLTPLLMVLKDLEHLFVMLIKRQEVI